MYLFLEHVHGPEDDHQVDDISHERVEGRKESDLAPDLDPLEVVLSVPNVAFEIHLCETKTKV
jgi:hypothetical protein